MTTIKDLKQDLIDHLLAIDKTKLSMMDLSGYCGIVKMLDDMCKPDFSATMQNLMTNMCATTGNSYRPVEMREGDTNG